MPADGPGTDHPQGPPAQVEALQPGGGEVPAAGAVHGLGEVVADGEQQAEDMLGHGIVAIGGHITYGDTVFATVIQINMIKTCRAGSDHFKVW